MSQRLLILGLDGATFEILDPLMARGDLPALAGLFGRGVRARLRSTMPVATLPAWTSFLTGCQPEQHGVTDLLVRPDGARSSLTPASGVYRGRSTFLQAASDNGASVVSLGVPGTFPPERVKGLVVSGFDCPGPGRVDASGVFPEERYPWVLKHGGWDYGAFNEFATQGPGFLAQALLDDLGRKEPLILNALNDPWSVFMVHLQASDTVAHHLWQTWDPKHPLATDGRHRDALPQVYRALDRLVAKMLAQLPREVPVMVVSDHGMGGASDSVVHLNRLLSQQGHLQFRPQPLGAIARCLARWGGAKLPGKWARRLGRVAMPYQGILRARPWDVEKTKAFSDELDYAPSIWLSDQDTRFDASADRLKASIIEAVLDLRDPWTNMPVVAAVHDVRAIKDAPFAHRVPDLLIEPYWHRGYRPSFLPTTSSGPPVRRREPIRFRGGKGAGMPGVHRREGVFLWSPPGGVAREAPPLEIAQAGSLVYRWLGMALDPEQLMPPSWAEALLGETGKRSGRINDPRTQEPLAGAQQKVLTDRLRQMGYL